MKPIHSSLLLPAPLALGIPPLQSHFLSFLSTTSYVASLYLAQKLFLDTKTQTQSKRLSHTINSSSHDPTSIPSISSTDPVELSYQQSQNVPKPGDRDHPETIKTRIKAVSIATILALGGVWYVVKCQGGYEVIQAIKPTLTLLGLPTSLSIRILTLSSILPYTLAPTLLLGPLVAMYLDNDLPFQPSYPGQTALASLKSWWNNWSLIETRNYIVGPVTEELVFRSTIISLSLLGKLSMKSLVFGTPLWFGIAHAHHAYETFKKNGANSSAAIQALAGGVFQLSYTTLFGWFAAYSFLRTGSILPPLISHIYCNAMGIYLPTTAVKRHPKRKAIIWTSYILGIAGFIIGLRKL